MKHIDQITALFELAPRHKKFKQELLDTVAKQDYSLVKNNATKEAKQLYRLHRGVATYFHLKRSFMRLDISKHGILYATEEIEHRVTDMILRFFHKRFPLFHIAIQYKNKTYVIDKKGQVTKYNLTVKQTVELLEQRLPINPLLEDLDQDETLWETYFNSQYIKERRNVKLMNKMMPMKYRKNNQTETVMAKRSQKLTEFI